MRNRCSTVAFFLQSSGKRTLIPSILKDDQYELVLKDRPTDGLCMIILMYNDFYFVFNLIADWRTKGPTDQPANRPENRYTGFGYYDKM